MLALLLTAQVLTAGGPALRVTVSWDRTLSCKANALLEKAVKLRLRVRVAPEGKAQVGDLLASLRRVGGADWRLELSRADGSIAISRELQPMACPQLADLSALILERYLSSIDWAGKDVALAPVTRSPRNVEGRADAAKSSPSEVEGRADAGVSSPSEVEGRVDAGTRVLDESVQPGRAQIRPEPEADPASSPRPSTPLGELGSPLRKRTVRGPLDPHPLTHFTLGAGIGAWLSVPLESSPTLKLDLSLRVVQRFRASLLFVGGTASIRGVAVDSLPRGSLTLQSALALGTFTLCTSGFAACGGLLAGARITAGTAAGPPSGPRVYNPITSVAGLPEVGAYGHFALPISGRLGLAADLAIAAPLGKTSFGITGIPSSVYETPSVDFLGSVALSLQLF